MDNYDWAVIRDFLADRLSVCRREMTRLKRKYAANPEGTTRMHYHDVEKFGELLAEWVQEIDTVLEEGELGP